MPSFPNPASAPARAISAAVVGNARGYRNEFLNAQPFQHVVIDNFFEAAFAELLLAEFPRFDPKLARNETGRTERKAVRTDIGNISPAYQRLYAMISGPEFLELISGISGIPDLLLDPKMFGGGTHENLHGQELDPHVDFNYDESRQLHRRLNLIVYLNTEWRSEWGGAIEIHSNPRRPSENQVRGYDPLFNRCVMFETNEHSWHGFPRINLPENKRHLSRKSISIYLYTRERPAAEVVPEHGTFYVQRPLPKHLVAGYKLADEDLHELATLLVRRDDWIAFYQNLELEKNRKLAEYVRKTGAPLSGQALQDGNAEGLYTDGWVASRVQIHIRPLASVSACVLRGFRPDSAPEGTFRVFIDGVAVAESRVSGEFELAVPVLRSAGETFELRIVCESEAGWAEAAGDRRDLAFILHEVEVRGT
jgi:hypothetical protein